MDRRQAMGILGLSDGFTESELRSAYRKACLEYHPDQVAKSNMDPDIAKEMMQDINEAYRVLKETGTTSGDENRHESNAEYNSKSQSPNYEVSYALAAGLLNMALDQSNPLEFRLDQLVRAAKMFNDISSYKDSATLARFCLEEIQVLSRQINSPYQREEVRRAKEREAKAKRKADAQRRGKEEELEKLYNMARLDEEEYGWYKSAVRKYEKLGNYRDSAQRKANLLKKIEDKKNEEKKLERLYKEAMAYVQELDYKKAVRIFEKLGNYRDSVQRKADLSGKIEEDETIKSSMSPEERRYNDARRAEEDRYYSYAAKIYSELGDYRDSAQRKADLEWIIEGKKVTSRFPFTRSEDKKSERLYNEARACERKSDYEKAIRIYEELGNYRDSALRKTDLLKKIEMQRSRSPEERYSDARRAEEDRYYSYAAKIYSELGDYRDSAKRLKDIKDSRF